MISSSAVLCCGRVHGYLLLGCSTIKKTAYEVIVDSFDVDYVKVVLNKELFSEVNRPWIWTDT